MFNYHRLILENIRKMHLTEGISSGNCNFEDCNLVAKHKVNMFAENLACDFNHFKFRFSPGLTENYTGHHMKLAPSVISDL